MFELNIITTLLLLHTLLNYIAGNKSTILSCGLFGFISDRATGASKFSWDKFNHLGLDNDERGGDSIGRVVGETIDKFVSKKAKTTYQDYVINTKNSDPSHIALGHTRKASVGEISEATAQPVVLDLPDGSGRFIMIHNGTLHNWEELAKKYDIDKKGKSDSMVFAEIIMNYGFGVLLEYNGAAAIIIKDDREPDTLKVFKGMSKGYGVKVDEERPLCYYQESETSMYISSKCDGLYFIGGDADNVIDFEPNKLYTIFGGQIISQEVFDRKDCSQNKIWPTTYVNTANNFSTRSYGYNRGMHINDDWNDGYGNEEAIAAYYEAAYPQAKETVKLSIRKDIISKSYNPKKIICARLRYYFMFDGATPTYANGIINLDESGVKGEYARMEGEKTYYFYRGIMLKDKDAFDKCIRNLGKARHFLDTEVNIMKICEYAEYPVCTLDQELPTWQNARLWDKNPGHMQCKAPLFTGNVTPLFSTKKYRFTNGELSSVEFLAVINKPVHKEVETKVITLPILYQHPTTCTCKECVEEMDKIFDKHNSLKAETERILEGNIVYDADDIDNTDEDLPADCVLCPDCNGSGETPNSRDVCTLCRGLGYIEEEKVNSSSDNALLKTALSEGLSAILMAIDACRNDIEVSGIVTLDAATAINNLSKLEDILTEENKFKKHTLITGYDNF